MGLLLGMFTLSPSTQINDTMLRHRKGGEGLGGVEAPNIFLEGAEQWTALDRQCFVQSRRPQ